jgi:hypothetical protein
MKERGTLMGSRLFHVIVICGAALNVAASGCGSEYAGFGLAAAQDPDPLDRCTLPDGSCIEHCQPLGLDQCIDPCFVHTSTCNPSCVQPDGSCGWPPTK